MIKKNALKARLSLVMVLMFMFSLVLPVVPAELIAVAEEGNGDNNEIQALGDLEIGDKVVDNSWVWEHRTGPEDWDGVPYSGEGETKPVTWIVVAKDHYGSDTGVTLLTEELIGRHPFDNSTDRCDSWDRGSNHWGDSGSTNATYGLREFLNGSSYDYDNGYSGTYSGAPVAEGDGNSYAVTFFDAFSPAFKDAVLSTEVPNRANNRDESPYSNEEYITIDKVFLPSQVELNGKTRNSHSFEDIWRYFKDAENHDRVAQLSENDWWYWTRSAEVVFVSDLGIVSPHGSLNYLDNAYNSHFGVRPALNLSSETLVSGIPNADAVYKILSEVEEQGYGDITGTGEITVSDAIIVLRHIVGLVDIAEAYGPEAMVRARVRGEADLSVSDAILILRHIVGLIEEFPAKED